MRSLEFVKKQLSTENPKTETLEIKDITIKCLVQKPLENETYLKLPPELENAIKSKIMLSLIRDNC